MSDSVNQIITVLLVAIESASQSHGSTIILHSEKTKAAILTNSPTGYFRLLKLSASSPDNIKAAVEATAYCHLNFAY